LDDSDTKSKQQKWQIMSAIVIEDKSFKFAELGASTIVEGLIPSNRMDKFEEFHASELYGGYGVFADIDQVVRFEAIYKLLALIEGLKLSVLYGAVDLARLQKEFYASADPLDICFRICLKGLKGWMEKRVDERPDVQLALEETFASGADDGGKFHRAMFSSMMEELVVLIMDECDKKEKETLHRSFRELRPPCTKKFEIHNLHDDMYFGDSRYSIGIQLADLCGYFIGRHMNGEAEVEGFFNIVEPHIVYSQVYPELQGEPALPIPDYGNLTRLASLMQPEADADGK
jgi:hypothetical protein